MPRSVPHPETVYRIWLIQYGRWQPPAWDAVPPVATALFAVEDVGTLSATEAAVFVRHFNEQMLAEPKHVWAVPVAVVPQYEGDLQPGCRVTPRMVDFRFG